LFDIHTQLEVILKALKSKNIEAEFSGRNDLIVKGKKFSGNAYYYGEKASYHHGTVMVNTDFEKMIKYLQVSAEKIKSKGIESVKARVINLKELNSELSIENIQQELEKQFKKIYQIKAEARTISPEKMISLKKLYQKYSSWEWRYGQAPNFSVAYQQRFRWGNIDLNLSLKKGIIKDAKIYSDAMNADLIEAAAGKTLLSSFY
jgi:lipoate-protein ligase A